MKSLPFFLLLPMLLQSCCIGGPKCNVDDTSARLRILGPSGQDLLFGPAHLYVADSIRLYSLDGGDTIRHSLAPIRGEGDSILYAGFDYRRFEIAYVRLSSSDVDTLQVDYPVTKSTRCCPGNVYAIPVSYNGKTVQMMVGGIGLIRK